MGVWGVGPMRPAGLSRAYGREPPRCAACGADPAPRPCGGRVLLLRVRAASTRVVTMRAYLLRLPDDLHHVARIAAATPRLGLQVFLPRAARAAILRAAQDPDGEPGKPALRPLQ